jgi:hypothetical protein
LKDIIESVKKDDVLAGKSGENIGKIKVLSWRGHQYVKDPKTDYGGVGWILAKNWFPYQRPTFVTPNFSGYVSGHSTYSRAAAELMTLLTGDEFFPGGMGEFVAKKNEFLVLKKVHLKILKFSGQHIGMQVISVVFPESGEGFIPPVDDLPGQSNR